MVAGCVVIASFRRLLSFALWNARKDCVTDHVAALHQKNVMLMKQENVSGIVFIIKQLRWEEKRG
jgi:hypothetical protein